MGRTVLRGLAIATSAVFAWLGAMGVSSESAPPMVEVLGTVEAPRPSDVQSLPAADTSTTSTTVSIESSTNSAVPSDSDVSARGVFEAPPELAAVPGTTTTSVPPTVDELGARALGLVRFDWSAEFPPWSIEFLDGRKGLRALTYPNEQRIEIYVRETDTARSLHRVLAHELGHMVDVERNSSSDRERWSRARGLDSSVDWWPSASAPDFATGAGDFAEAFAVWETGIDTQSTVGPQPGTGDLALVAELAQS